MALATRNEIAEQIRDLRAEFDTDSDRATHELADSLTPIYYNDILTEWADLPNEARDEWQELGAKENATIFDLMQTDLFWFYFNQIAELWAEIQGEHICEAELAPNLYKSSPMNGAIRCHDCDTLIIAECACEANEHDCTETN